ncbi:hypothetical protein [Shimia abyssi]|uniref:hypothetical protein n=1 Tax=Shimia abyssi TaxID=1662395 RepID=UPI0010574FF4|nr:hypothetical protein [Shimia abyssi]
MSENRDASATRSVIANDVEDVPKAAVSNLATVREDTPSALVLTPALRVLEDETDIDQAESDPDNVMSAEGDSGVEVALDEAGIPSKPVEQGDYREGGEVTDCDEPQHSTEGAELSDAAQESDFGGAYENALGVSLDGDAQALEVSEVSEQPLVDDELAEDGLDEEEPFDFQRVLDARIVHWRDGDGLVEEPDSPGDSDYAGTEPEVSSWEVPNNTVTEEFDTASGFEAVISDEIIEEAVPEVAQAVDEAAVIDEDILREMVADIVRQELQGALGERITRNVRKLVRREIHRALAAHDLD